MKSIIERDPGSLYEFHGIVGDYINALSDNWLKTVIEYNPRLLNEIRNRNNRPKDAQIEAWAGEFTGKYITSAVEVYRITRDPELRKQIEYLVNELASLQADNGYLGVFPTEYEFTGKQPGPQPSANVDGWNHYHIMLGMYLWYKESGDAKALTVCRKIGDMICDKFLGKPGNLTQVSIREYDFAIIHGLALLHKETGEQKYLDMALQIADQELPIGAGLGYPRGMDFVNRALDGEEYYQTSFPPGARWECMHTIIGLSELYKITGRERYKQAVQHIWWSLVKTDRHNNGGWGSLEQAQGTPYQMRAMEICCVIAWTALGIEVLNLTGDPIAADELELSFWNAILASQHRSGKSSAYNMPSDGRITPSAWAMGLPNRLIDSEICCCSVNVPRGFGLLSDWSIMRDNEGLVLNYYGASELSAKVSDVNISLQQKTDYPRTGNIDIVVTPDKPHEFTLKLRIPHWSGKGTRVSVNGKAVRGVKSGQYLSVKRMWHPGDRIKLNLDMPLHYWVGEDEAAGRTSIYRGPILLTYLRKKVTDLLAFNGDWKPYISARHLPFVDLYGSNIVGDFVSYKFTGESITWMFNTFDNCGKAEVKIDGKVVDTVDLYAPISDSDPFVYYKDKPNLYVSARKTYGGLAPGNHRIEIKVLGERNEASKDNWVNVRELVADADDPVFDALNMKGELLPSGTDGSIVSLEFTDTKGRKVRLMDYDSAGENGNPYISWLNVLNAPKSEWSHENPTRSGRP